MLGVALKKHIFSDVGWVVLNDRENIGRKMRKGQYGCMKPRFLQVGKGVGGRGEGSPPLS